MVNYSLPYTGLLSVEIPVEMRKIFDEGKPRISYKMVSYVVHVTRCHFFA